MAVNVGDKRNGVGASVGSDRCKVAEASRMCLILTTEACSRKVNSKALSQIVLMSRGIPCDCWVITGIASCENGDGDCPPALVQRCDIYCPTSASESGSMDNRRAILCFN